MCVCVFVYLHGFYSVCMVTEELTNSASRTGSTNRTDTVPPACGETNKSGERARGPFMLDVPGLKKATDPSQQGKGNIARRSISFVG